MAYISPSTTGNGNGNGNGAATHVARTVAAPRSLDLAELPAIFWLRRRLILATMLAALAAGLAFATLVKPTYLSSTRLLIDPRGLQVVDRELTPRAPQGEATLAVVESQMRVLTSDNVLARVIEKLDLQKDPEFGGERGGLSSWIRSMLPSFLRRSGADADGSFPGRSGAGPDASLPGRSGVNPDASVAVLTEFRKTVRSERLQNSFIVDLSVSTTDREKSARIANAIAAVYTDLENTNREQLALRTSTSLDGRLAELKTKLRGAEEAVERYKRQNDILITGSSSAVIAGTGSTQPGGGSAGNLFSDQELTQLNLQLAQSRTQAAQAQARAEQIERVLRAGGSPDSITEAIQSPTIGQLRVRLSVAQQQAASLAVDLLPGHPSLVQARARVADANNEIRGELGRIARAARADLERARASERELTANLERTKRQRGTTDQARVQLRELEREADASRVIFETFLVRARELGEQKAVDPTNARVISPAVAATEARGLRPALLLPLSLMFGLGLGGVLALARESLDPIVRTARHAEDAAGIQVLATLPAGTLGRAYGNHRNARLTAFVAEQPDGKATAAMRRLRASLGGGSQNGGPRTVLVTALDEQDGKTAVALNLALAAAQGGENVLLIDGDTLRHRLTTQRLGQAPDGLLDVLQNRASLEEALVQDPTGLIRLLPTMRTGGAPARLTEPAIRFLLVEKCRAFDLVIVDGGLIGVDYATNLFAAVVDEIVPVVRCDRVRKDDLAGATAKLEPHGRKLRGIVLVAG